MAASFFIGLIVGLVFGVMLGLMLAEWDAKQAD